VGTSVGGEVNEVTNVEGVTGWRVNGIHDLDDKCCSSVPLCLSILRGHEGVV
jgi:hypothetical protein